MTTKLLTTVMGQKGRILFRDHAEAQQLKMELDGPDILLTVKYPGVFQLLGSVENKTRKRTKLKTLYAMSLHNHPVWSTVPFRDTLKQDAVVPGGPYKLVTDKFTSSKAMQVYKDQVHSKVFSKLVDDHQSDKAIETLREVRSKFVDIEQHDYNQHNWFFSITKTEAYNVDLKSLKHEVLTFGLVCVETLDVFTTMLDLKNRD